MADDVIRIWSMKMKILEQKKKEWKGKSGQNDQKFVQLFSNQRKQLSIKLFALQY